MITLILSRSFHIMFGCSQPFKCLQTQISNGATCACNNKKAISWHKYVNEDLTFSQIFEEDLSNRQEKRVTYYPNGAIYVFKSELIRKRKYFSTKSYAYLMERNKSIDIDYIDDFRYAEFLLRERKSDGAI